MGVDPGRKVLFILQLELQEVALLREENSTGLLLLVWQPLHGCYAAVLQMQR